ncbi:MAG: protein kinase, partial [Anaerolineae bacterium]|nr:protein kinase [Anaerolineae bacterium]
MGSRLQRGPLSLDDVVRLVDQVAKALTVAHRNNVIHRDLKPDNILLDDDDNALLADFGIAKSVSVERGITAEGHFVGDPWYVAPEQVAPEPVISPAVDVYTLGIILFEAITGEHPFPDGLGTVQVLHKQMHDPLPSVLDLRPDLPPALDDVIQRATVKDPADRTPNALTVAVEFSRAASGHAMTYHVGSPTFVPAPPRDPDQPELLTVVPTPPLPEIVSLRNPYKGLRPFEEADAADFFGRDALVERLLARLAEPELYVRFLAVVGPSGSGKSSAVKAGLLPALRQGILPNSDGWFISEFMPGGDPMKQLENALASVAVRRPGRLLEQLQADPRGLLWAAENILPGDDCDLLLVVDQFEELFAADVSEALRVQFLDLILTAVSDPESRVRVIVTLRADFTDRPLLYPEFGELIRQRTEFVLALSSAELEQAVLQPARRVGAALEPELLAAVIADVRDEPGALPMLQYALTEVFEAREGQVMTLAAYRQIGGVLGALAMRAEAVFRQLTPHRQTIARQVFLRLVTLGEGTEDTRRRARQTELASVVDDYDELEAVLDEFGKSRLLTSDRDPATREPTVEVAHEALIREWSSLRQWLDESRDDIRIQRKLAASCQEWLDHDSAPGFLVREGRLVQFEVWAAETDIALTPHEFEYLDISISARRARKAHEDLLERRARQRLWALVAGMAVFLAVAIGLSFFAFLQAEEAEKSEQEALRIADESQALLWTTYAEQAVEDDRIELAVALALVANQMDAPPIFAHRRLTEVAYLPGLIARFDEHSSRANSVAYSPDGHYALSGASDNQLIMWDLDAQAVAPQEFALGQSQTVTSVAFDPLGRYAISGLQDGAILLGSVDLPGDGQPLRQFEGHSQTVDSMAFSPDGQWVLSGSQDDTCKLWDVATGALLRTFVGHTDAVTSVAFSSDGQFVLSGSWDKTLMLWDANTGTLLYTFEGHTDSVYSVAYSMDGQYALSGSGDQTMILWDINTRTAVATLSGEHSARILSVAISPDGKYALSGAEDSLVILWDLETHTKLYTLRGHNAPVGSVAFNPSQDGRQLTALSAGNDTMVLLWRIGSGAVLRTLRSTTGELLSVAFDPGGQYAVTSSRSNALDVWEIATGIHQFALQGHTAKVQSVAYSPNGNWIASGARDNFVIIWDVRTKTLFQQLEHHTSYVNCVTISPDSNYVLSGSQDQDVILWDINTGQVVYQLGGHRGPVQSVAFSPDGTMAASGSSNGTIILWDLNTGTQLRTLRGGHNNYVSAVAFSPDGRQLLSGSGDSTLVLWAVATGDLLRPFRGHDDEVTSVAFHPNGNIALSASRDATLILWDLTETEFKPILSVLRGHTDQVNEAVFAPDGR